MTIAPRQPPLSLRGSRAFTLIEVILAIVIAVGILVVALYFYSQSADLRARLMDESDRLAAIRLYLDRLTADLRAAYAQPQVGFSGDASALRFVTAAVPSRRAWQPAASTRRPIPETDLTLVRYGTRRGVEGTNVMVLGLTRTEQPLQGTPRQIPAVTNAVDRTAPGPDREEMTEPLIEGVRFLQLAYWDGSGWSDHWDSPSLPGGIEVTLGAEPLPNATDPLDYPFEVFRRVVFLPGSGGAAAGDDPFAELFESGTGGRK